MQSKGASRFRRQGIGPRAERSLGLLVLCGCLCTCEHENAAKRECPPCRQSFTKDEQVETEVIALWQRVENELGSDARGLDLRCQCFGDGESFSLDGESLYLRSSGGLICRSNPADCGSRGWSKKELAARAAHLAFHRKNPPWNADPDRNCATGVQEAVRSEARAHALELEARRALGETVQRYPFESGYFATPVADRPAFLTEYFLTHPFGDGVVPGFVAQYESLCASEAAKVAP